MLKNYWKGKIKYDWPFGLLLILIFAILRFTTVLYGIQSGDNKYLSFIFILMIIIPFFILSKDGKEYIKIKKPKNLTTLFYSFLLGGIICILIFFIGQILYGNELANWFKYIGESYPINFEELSISDKNIYFIIFIIIGMTFSPFGEELLYRGLIHGSLIKRFGDHKSAIIDSLAFGLTHLAHFGIIYQKGTWDFYLVPSLIWITLIFVTGLAFNYCRKISDSIWGAIISHMAFNMVMTYLIFYEIF
ncbi:MAG: CPBP family intramembrane metalloprotease [Maribacter sp.]|nr:CPBP family intramembrane metalloprotease [Maribacter sp.]